MAKTSTERVRAMRERSGDRRLDVTITRTAKERLIHIMAKTGMSKSDVISTLLESYDFQPLGEGENAEYYEGVQDATTST